MLQRPYIMKWQREKRLGVPDVEPPPPQLPLSPSRPTSSRGGSISSSASSSVTAMTGSPPRPSTASARPVPNYPPPASKRTPSTGSPTRTGLRPTSARDDVTAVLPQPVVTPPQPALPPVAFQVELAPPKRKAPTLTSRHAGHTRSPVMTDSKVTPTSAAKEIAAASTSTPATTTTTTTPTTASATAAVTRKKPTKHKTQTGETKTTTPTGSAGRSKPNGNLSKNRGGTPLQTTTTAKKIVKPIHSNVNATKTEVNPASTASSTPSTTAEISLLTDTVVLSKVDRLDPNNHHKDNDDATIDETVDDSAGEEGAVTTQTKHPSPLPYSLSEGGNLNDKLSSDNNHRPHLQTVADSAAANGDLGVQRSVGEMTDLNRVRRAKLRDVQSRSEARKEQLKEHERQLKALKEAVKPRVKVWWLAFIRISFCCKLLRLLF